MNEVPKIDALEKSDDSVEPVAQVKAAHDGEDAEGDGQHRLAAEERSGDKMAPQGDGLAPSKVCESFLRRMIQRGLLFGTRRRREVFRREEKAGAAAEKIGEPAEGEVEDPLVAGDRMVPFGLPGEEPQLGNGESAAVTIALPVAGLSSLWRWPVIMGAGVGAIFVAVAGSYLARDLDTGHVAKVAAEVGAVPVGAKAGDSEAKPGEQGNKGSQGPVRSQDVARQEQVNAGSVAPPREKTVLPATSASLKTTAAPSPEKQVEPAKGKEETGSSSTGSSQETEVLAMITEYGAMLRETRAEMATLRADGRKLTGAVNNKLADFERRLSFGEARRALDSAKLVPPSDAAGSPAPELPPIPVRAGGSAKGSSKSVRAATTAPPAAAPHYRVQAASPGLAMLAEIGGSGDAHGPLPVVPGQTVPGYGKVVSISQRGVTWVVQTTAGVIE